VSRLAQLYPDHQRSMVGFSLGGNFALRIGASHELTGKELLRIVAVSPVLDPQATLQALETGLPLYRRYFIDKWRRSLLKKQRAWPAQYDFAHLSQLRDLTRMTEDLVLQHTQYSTLAQYLQGYAITGEVLRSLQVASHLIIAQDDPIIPAQDLNRLHPHEQLQITVTEHGGHCGFRDSLFGDGWLDRFTYEDLVGAG
jgi:predicted alpha/beta-fold hydrolase